MELGKRRWPLLGPRGAACTLESLGRRSRCLGKGGGGGSPVEEGAGEPEVGCRFLEGKAQRRKGLPGGIN